MKQLFQTLPALDLPFDGLADDREPVFALSANGVNPAKHLGRERQGDSFGELFLASHAHR